MNESSKIQWNRGLISPVEVPMTNDIEDACNGYFPTCIPTLMRGSHFGALWVLWSVLSRTKTVHLKVFSSLTSIIALEREKCAMRGWPYAPNQVQLANLTALSITNVYNSKEIISVQHLMALRRIVREEYCTCAMLLSAMLFCKWALTPQKLVVWPHTVHALMKLSSAKRPLSEWWCRIVTPYMHALKADLSLDSFL